MRYIAHKKAKKLVDTINENRNDYFFIHYSCESFINNRGKSSKIAAIAIKSLRTGDTKSFSIHMIAEEYHYNANQIERDYKKLEKEMLLRFYDYLKEHRNNRFIHWNMSDENYGFNALEHRAKILGINDKKIIPLEEKNKINLAVLLRDYYGENYTHDSEHMYKIVVLNGLINNNDSYLNSEMFLRGKDEAVAFEQHQYLKLFQSTLKKVECFYRIFSLLCDGILKTEATKKEIYGNSFFWLICRIRSTTWGSILIWSLGIILSAVVGGIISNIIFK